MMFASDRRRLGALAAPRWQVATGWAIAAVIVVLTAKVLVDAVLGD